MSRDRMAGNRLAADQSALVASLVGSGQPPPGFATARLAALADVLRAKRRKGVARSCPELREALGTAFRREFDRYAEEMPLPTGADSIDDAWRFLRWLRRGRRLPREVRWLGLQLRVRRAGRRLSAWLRRSW